MDKDKDKDKRSLYDEALDRFRKDAAGRYADPKDKDNKDMQLLAEFLKERATPEETRQAAEVLQANAGKKYGSRKLGDAEIPESWITNIMTNIESFVAAGDFLTQSAPETVGMAWYAVKLTLTAIQSNYELYTFFGSGLSDISEIMIIVRHYDRLYDERTKPEWKPSPLVDKLFQDVISAYAAVLDFSFAIKRHLTAGALTRIKHGFKDFFGLSKAKFEDKLSTVATLKKKILEESQGAFQDKTLTQLQSVSTVLAGIEGTVRHIQDFQDTQKKLHEEALARFDVLLKGLDDIRASTKRKTQWDYAVQDYQMFQEALDPLEGSFKVLGDTIDGVYPGTCQWVFEERLYKDWVGPADNKMLCITGPEGSGKSYVVATIADRITRDDDPDNALLYVSCTGSTSGAVSSNQPYTADSICRTFLSQLYDLAVQGEDNVGLLEACNAIFKKAKAQHNSILNQMRTDSAGLPEFVESFSQIASLLKKRVFLVLDDLNRAVLDDRNQAELLRKVQGLVTALSEKAGTRLHILIGCASSSKFFNDLDLLPGFYIDVQHNNRGDIELVLTDALKDVPGLSAAEQEAAKIAILEKARSRFLYVRDTAIPFMREPFQRPLSRRLAALPDGTSDVYSNALQKMSPNYLDLLRTALTWTLFAPTFPGFPHAREIMDGFQGTYDILSETDVDIDKNITAGFPQMSRLELEQLRGAIDPFLTLFPDPDGTVWVYKADAIAVAEFFIKSSVDVPQEPEDHTHLCARCGCVRSPTQPLFIDPKQAHLQMALTCLRHLNHPLFQRRAGLLGAATEGADGADTEKASLEGAAQEGNGAGAESTAPQNQSEVETEAGGDQDPEEPNVDGILQEAQDGYATEKSIDDEDVTQRGFYDLDPADFDATPGEESEDGEEDPTRARYEIEYWPWHMRNAEQLWSAEEREKNSDWAALMDELDKLVFTTPRVFTAWQSKYYEKKDQYTHATFSLSAGPHKALHVAAYFGLNSWVEHLLNRGQDLNELSNGFSPLQAAASSGRPLDTMKLLMERGADVNAENGAGRTAFHHWLLRGDLTVDGMRVLLEHGADPCVHSSLLHYNALQYFAFRGEDPEVVDLLLAHGVDINALDPRDEWKFPPLHVLLFSRPDVPRPLLEAFVKHKADTNWENAASARPLQMVCTNGQFENLKILLKSEVLEVDDPDLHGTTAVHEATFFGHTECVGALLEHGADPDIADKLDRIALHSAARKGLAEPTRVLLQYTKQANRLDKQGWTPLFCACLSKNETAATMILDALIERDLPLAEINKQTRTSRTVLRQAADHGFDKVVSKLIQLASDRNDAAALDINGRDTQKGMTALHRAAMNGHAACVRALLSAGADVSLLDTQSRSALTLAREKWSVSTKNPAYEEILAQLITADPAAAASDPDLVAVCAANGSVPLLTQLWRLNAQLNRPDRFGWTPLDLARRFGRPDAEAFLTRQAAWASLLPRRWERRFPGTTAVGAPSVCDDGTSVAHVSGKRVCVSADRPLPPGLEGYYFEITLREAGGQGDGAAGGKKKEWPEMAIGLCTLGGAALEFPGWWDASESETSAKSWGYHSDTGGVYSSVEDRETFVDATFEAQRYRVGDTVGCGVDLGKGEIYFTKNGVRLERSVKEGVEGRLVPVVGLHEAVCFETNFGREGDPAFKWNPSAQAGADMAAADRGAVMEVVVLGGKGEDAEKRAGVQVTSDEIVVVAPN